jgi:hypothetical protein
MLRGGAPVVVQAPLGALLPPVLRGSSVSEPSGVQWDGEPLARRWWCPLSPAEHGREKTNITP